MFCQKNSVLVKRCEKKEFRKLDLTQLAGSLLFVFETPLSGAFTFSSDLGKGEFHSQAFKAEHNSYTIMMNDSRQVSVSIVGSKTPSGSKKKVIKE